MAKDKPSVASVPGLPDLQSALDEVVRQIKERLDAIQAGLPPEVQMSTNQVYGVISDVLGSAQWASLYGTARQDLFNLALTGRSNVRHDPVHLA